MRGSCLRVRRSTIAAAAGLALAASAVVASAAQPAGAAQSASAAAPAGSIVYIKHGNVWIAHANGSRARQFTVHPFNWSSPSEADNGTIVVAGGRAKDNPGGTDSAPGAEIYRFAPNGNQLGGAIPTWGTYSSPACPTFGPTSVAVSPDGKKIAYGIWECATPAFTALWTPANATSLDLPHQHVGQLDFYEPHWVNNSTFLVSHYGQVFADSDARWYTHSVNQSDDTGLKGWNEPAMTGTGAQAVISPAGDKLAVFEDDAANWTDNRPRSVRLWIYTGKNIPANWTKRCVIKLNAAQVHDPLKLDPSFSPNGKELIWGDSRGIEEAWLGTPASCASIKPHLLIAGGSEPFFSAGTEHARLAKPHQPG